MSRPSSTGLRSSYAKSNRYKSRKQSTRVGDSTLDRASTTTAAIRRGDLKISGPIPIAQEDDEEFPPRNTDGSKLLQSPVLPNHRQPSPQTSLIGINGAKRPYTATESTYQVSVLGPEKSVKQRPKTTGAEYRAMEKPTEGFASRSPPHGSTASYAPKTNPNRKSRDSSLRLVMRKLLGRKSKHAPPHTTVPSQIEARQLANGRGSQFGADSIRAKEPRNLTMTAMKSNDSLYSARPVTPQRSHNMSLSPLGSHSPHATYIQYVSDPPGPITSESLPSHEEEPQSRRPSTSPSHQSSSVAGTPTRTTWTYMAQRPVSAHNQTPRLFTPEAGEGGIGFAVTSGSNPKRRSRSAGAMRGVAKDAGESSNLSRRRSAEIKYLRESGGYLTQALPDPEVLDERGIHTEDNFMPQALEQGSENQLGQGPRPRHQNFSYISPRSDAYNHEYTGSMDLESRVSKLEDKMTDTEFAITKLKGRASRATVIIERPPSQGSRERSVPSRYSTSRTTERSSYYSDDQRASRKRSSMAFDQSSASGTSRSPTPPPKFVSAHRLTASDATRPREIRPISGSTIRAARSHDPIPSIPHPPSVIASGLTSEHYTTLLSLILREQSARKRLEGHVTLLQREVEELRSRIYDPAYPTPSPDLPAPSHQTMSHQQTPMGGQNGRRHFAGFEGWGAREQEGTDSEFVDEDEVYETPTEGRDHEFSGTEDEDVDEIGVARMTRGRAIAR